MIEVIAFAGTFTHAGKHRQTCVLLGDVVDQLKHVHGLAHAGAAEQANLAALGERADQVDHLDAGFKQLHRRRQFVECRGLLVNGATLVGRDRTGFVDRTSENVHDAAQRRETDRHGNRCAVGGNRHATTETV
ncbi:cellobiose phosphorylase [Mycobacteroides abscessus subsp. abscessus]|nr:cellobiose phosphorylase [Mycobacteroides abscessus subsp. abscessus]